MVYKDKSVVIFIKDVFESNNQNKTEFLCLIYKLQPQNFNFIYFILEIYSKRAFYFSKIYNLLDGRMGWKNATY